MGIDSSIGVERGSTFYGADQTIDTADYAAVAMEGMTAVFKDYFKTTDNVDKLRSGRPVYAMLVRNVSAVTLYRGRVLRWKQGYEGKRVDGYATVTAAEFAGVVDDYYGSTGIRVGDLFWMIVRGPTLVLSPMAPGEFLNGGAYGAWSCGDILYALTAATSGCTTAGRGTKWGGTASSTETTDGTAASVARNMFGKVLNSRTDSYTSTAGAATTADTNTLIMTDLRPAW